MNDHGTTERYDDGCRCPACVVAQTGRELHARREAMRRELLELITEAPAPELEDPVEPAGPDAGDEPAPVSP